MVAAWQAPCTSHDVLVCVGPMGCGDPTLQPTADHHYSAPLLAMGSMQVGAGRRAGGLAGGRLSGRVLQLATFSDEHIVLVLGLALDWRCLAAHECTVVSAPLEVPCSACAPEVRRECRRVCASVGPMLVRIRLLSVRLACGSALPLMGISGMSHEFRHAGFGGKRPGPLRIMFRLRLHFRRLVVRKLVLLSESSRNGGSTWYVQARPFRCHGLWAFDPSPTT